MDDYYNTWKEDDEDEENPEGIEVNSQIKLKGNYGRPKKKQSKEQAMLGIWASSDEEDNPKQTKKETETPKNFKQQFVKGNTMDSEDETEEMSNGFSKSTDKYQTIGKQEEEEEEEENFRPSFGQIKDNDDSPPPQTQAPIGTEKKQPTARSFAQFKKNQRNILKSAPEFEKFTKGVGSKILEKFGWKPGEGLGREQQGINRPIEVKVRPKNRGLGFDFDERTQQQKEDFPTEGDIEEKMRKGKIQDDEEISQQEMEPLEPAWKKSSKRSQKKKYKVPTLPTVHTTITKITDMTSENGPRVLDTVKELYTTTANSDFEQELQHNIRLLVDLKENDILNIDRQTQKDKEQIEKMKNDKVGLLLSVESEEKKLTRLREVTKMIDNCYEKIKKKQMELEKLAALFVLFQRQYQEEYKEYKLQYLASAMVLPLLKDKLEVWNPLQDPSSGFEEFKIWFDLIGPKQSSEEMEFDDEDFIKPASKELDVYTQLIVDILLPKIRNTLTNKWNVKNPEDCLQLFDIWKPILPEIVLENVLEQLILPKLYQAVETWNPKIETIRADLWLVPWMPLLKERMVPLLAPVRHKLMIALQEWTPEDSSAHSILTPWKDVFDFKGMQAIIDRCILPKLNVELDKFEVNPANQIIAPLDWVLSWQDLIPINKLSLLIETFFFPKWHNALYTWLSVPNPNFEQIQRWYMGWKQKFEPLLIQQSNIVSQFKQAMTLLSSKIQGQPVPVPLPSTPQRSLDSSQIKSSPIVSSPSVVLDIGFKEMVARFVESKGEYLLTTSKLYEGKTIYEVGKKRIVLEKEVVYQIVNGKLKPIDIENLIEGEKEMGDVD